MAGSPENGAFKKITDRYRYSPSQVGERDSGIGPEVHKHLGPPEPLY